MYYLFVLSLNVPIIFLLWNIIDKFFFLFFFSSVGANGNAKIIFASVSWVPLYNFYAVLFTSAVQNIKHEKANASPVYVGRPLIQAAARFLPVDPHAAFVRFEGSGLLCKQHHVMTSIQEWYSTSKPALCCTIRKKREFSDLYIKTLTLPYSRGGKNLTFRANYQYNNGGHHHNQV